MKVAEYKTHTTRTLPDLGESLKGITLNTKELGIIHTISSKLNLSHMALGLCTELGELIERVGTELKTHIDDMPGLREELGDIYWYHSNYANLRGIPLPEPEDMLIEAKESDALDLLINAITNLTDQVKRFMAYNKEIDRAKELNFVYNISTGLYLIEKIYKLDGGDIRERNINKLRTRYPDKFSDEKAVNRDLEAERKLL